MSDNGTSAETIVQQATTGTEPKEYTFDFGDGNVYRSKDPEDLAKQVGERYRNLHTHLKTVEQENRQLRTKTEDKPKTEYDAQVYYNLWNEDPAKAQRYLNQFDPDYNNAVERLQRIEWDTQAAAFRHQNPDFVAKQENIDKMGLACQKLYPGASTLTADQMTAAHAYCVKHKMYEVAEAKAETPPPPPPKSSSAQPEAPDIGKMSQDELRQYIEKIEKQQ